MKKRKVIFFILALSIIAMCSGFAQDFAGKRIAVIEPEIINSNESVAWIPLFVQGLITTNLQNYSKMEVIDRQNLDKVKVEQRLSENSANSEAEAPEFGKLATPQYIVIVKMINKNGNFALDCKVTDIETNKLVGKTYSNPNCSQDAIENGDAINEASRQLLIGLGIPESSLIALITTTDSTPKQQQAVKSNAALAKGIAAENVSKNVVTALSYYQDALSADASLTEANDRLANLTSVVSTGNMREDIKNDIALRKEWIKIIDDLTVYLDKNLYITLYDPKLEVENINYETERADLSMSAFIGLNPKALKVMVPIMEGFEKVNKESWKLGLWYNRSVKSAFYLYDENNVWFSTTSCSRKYSFLLTELAKMGKNITNGNVIYYDTKNSLVPLSAEKSRCNEKLEKVSFKNIPYTRITDSISVSAHHHEITSPFYNIDHEMNSYTEPENSKNIYPSMRSSIAVDEYVKNGGLK